MITSLSDWIGFILLIVPFGIMLWVGTFMFVAWCMKGFWEEFEYPIKRFFQRNKEE